MSCLQQCPSRLSKVGVLLRFQPTRLSPVGPDNPTTPTGHFPQSRMASSTARTSRDIHISQSCDLVGILRRTVGFQGGGDTSLAEYASRFLWAESFQYARRRSVLTRCSVAASALPIASNASVQRSSGITPHRTLMKKTCKQASSPHMCFGLLPFNKETKSRHIPASSETQHM